MISGLNKLSWRSILSQIVPEPAASEQPGDASTQERFAIPYKFTPRLSVSEAAIFALRALVRIFLGSILFGTWGAYSLLVWTSIPNAYVRGAAMIPMFALFLALLAGMMVVTARFSPRRLPR